MTKRMLISVDRDESRAAIVDNGQLVHLEIEPVDRNTNKGNIYRAVVARVEPSLQSAFVDFGNEKQGFLPVAEIHPRWRTDNSDKRAQIQDVLKQRSEVLVQVVRDEIGQKGATLSTFVSLPGRYLVLIPDSDKDAKAGVSRKLSDEARDRIKNLTETMQVPAGFGLIVRTAGETATEKELEKDLLYLVRQWAHIEEKFASSKGPTLLYAERSLPVRFVRDYFTLDIDEVVIDDDETLREVHEFLEVLMPRGLQAISRYHGDMPLFARYGIEGKVEDVYARQVFLAGGGSIVIDQTEALVSIDVNSGRVKEKDIEETARATNIEAAREIARQLVLRDLGGLVVIDFIDMREKKNQRDVEQALKDAFKNDKARIKLGHISEFGLMELSRQRIKASVNKGAFDSCPHCSGTGRIRAMEGVGISMLRRIYELVSQKRVRYVLAMVPPEAARYLQNARRSELAAIEKQYHLQIEVFPVQGMTGSQVVLEHLEEAPLEAGGQKADRVQAVKVTQTLDLVRNQLIRREEARIQLEAAVAARRNAKVDYADIYREVREVSGPDSPLPTRTPAKSEAKAEPQLVPVVVQDWVEEEPATGFWASVKAMFGLSEPPKKKMVERTEMRPASGAASSPAAAAPAGGDRSEGRGDGRRDRRDRRDRDRRDRGDRGDRPERQDRQEQRAGETKTERSEGRPERAEPRADQRPRPERAERQTEPRPDTNAADGQAADVAAEGGEGRRRRRRRRRGGQRGLEGVELASSGQIQDGDLDGDESGDDRGEGEGSAPEAVEEHASAAIEAQATTEDEDHASGEFDPAQGEDSAQAAAETAPEEVAPAEASEATVPLADLVQAEIERLRTEQASTGEPEPTVEQPAEDSPKITGKKPFVLDLRTGSR